ncbi:prepilin signal peptidase PulO-like peptidase [Cryptosporangium arvum DSM 44712]|uniref:Prepilin leader peptidase/N-methyltransferase n=1 Tax=Cryptosporangium arvum DSM 44712 TaxID=927661 RepID=A0A011AGA5_9ACTN|nr:A24 family peptidase [Cryptosporangium arvum]EXG81056.1 prepilin signal peptidase PulO-like peptidase [Cryptosporangium arvum DSM 44712]
MFVPDDTVIAAVAGVLGLVVGSFLNVVVYRVPRAQSLVRPASHCPACTAPIRPWHNVPVLGWLVLRGRCADCREPISVRYPLVELGTGVLFAAVTARFGLSPELPAYLYLAAIAVALALIDLDVMRLPDRIVLPSYLVTAILLLVAAVAAGSWQDAGRALLAMAALYAGYWLLAFVYPDGMGFGDVKLAGLLGLYLGWLGWNSVWVGTFAGFLVGGVVGMVLLATRRATGRTAIPFGPAMLVGGFLAVFAATPITVWYSSLLLPSG